MPDVLFEKTGKAAILTLNRPDIRNAISGAEMIREIESACRQASADESVSVLIITGADPAFSSGGNIKEMAGKKGMFAGTPDRIAHNYRTMIQRIPKAVCSVEIPTIAAVNGPAIGAGCDLALMCDMRIASRRAVFGETFLSVGLIPGDGGAFFLPMIVGMACACEMTFTADIIDAGRALEMGLVNRVVAHSMLMESTLALAEKIAEKPRHALVLAKKLLYSRIMEPLMSHLDTAASFQALCHSNEKHDIALARIMEKKKK